MFKRFPYLSLLIAVVVAALVAVPAMATDEVPAPPAPSDPPGQSAPAPTGGSCTDNSKPSARISTKAGAARSKLTVRGTSSDRGCGASGSGAVSRVTVSVQRKRGKRCQFLSSKGKLSSAKSCKSPKWLSAHGTSNWSFGMPKSLPRGTYVVHVRALDSAGNVGAQTSLRVRMR